MEGAPRPCSKRWSGLPLRSVNWKTTEDIMNCKKLLLALFLAGHACWFAAANAVAADAVQLRTGAGQAMEATLYRPAAAGPFPAHPVLAPPSGLAPPVPA